MSLAAAGRMRRELCTALICIDSFEEYNASGRLYHNSLNHEFYFRSLLELIEELDYIFNSMDYPQATVKLRSFAEETNEDKQQVRMNGLPSVYSGNARGSISTFRVRVMFRQNASWQGTMEWVEENREESFRSVLEFIHLLNSAIPAELKKQEEIKTDIAM